MRKCVFQDQRASRVNRNARGKFRQRRRTQRRQKGRSKIRGEAKGQRTESVEGVSVPTPEPAETQRADLQEEHQPPTVDRPTLTMVHAQTQTWCLGGRNMSTQTPVVGHSHQKTQTDEREEPGVASPNTGESQPEEEKRENPDQDSAQPPGSKRRSDGGSPNPAESRSEAMPPELSHAQRQKGDDQRTYAKAVRGNSGSDTEPPKAEDTLPEPPQNPQYVHSSYSHYRY